MIEDELVGREFEQAPGESEFEQAPGESEGQPSLSWEDPWRRAWQPTPLFLPGDSP